MVDQHTIDEYLRTRKNLPWEWEEVICSCDVPGYSAIPDTDDRDEEFAAIRKNRTDDQFFNGVYRFCRKCSKRLRWQFLKCRECGDLFDYQFKHHAIYGDGWARHKSLCWNHICEKDPAVEGDIPPLILKAPRTATLDISVDFDFD